MPLISTCSQLKKLHSQDIQFVSQNNIIHKGLAEEFDLKVMRTRKEQLYEQINLSKYLKGIK